MLVFGIFPVKSTLTLKRLEVGLREPQIFFAKTLQLEDVGWNKLMFRWINFFIFLALLNELIWRTQTEEFWVNFKVWGILIITFIFTFFQVSLINKYKIKNDQS